MGKAFMPEKTRVQPPRISSYLFAAMNSIVDQTIAVLHRDDGQELVNQTKRALYEKGSWVIVLRNAMQRMHSGGVKKCDEKLRVGDTMGY